MTGEIILLIEDNEDHVFITKRALKANKIINEVVVARDGQEALDYLHGTGSYAGRDTQDAPALILLDLKLPKVDGFEVLKSIRSDEQTKLMPVVVLTSSQEEEDILHSYENGANSYIRKPIDYDDLVETIRNVGVYWLLMNKLPPQRRHQ